MNKKYYFIGIKGSGMSALALLLNSLGHEVIGSDVSEEVFTQFNLDKQQIKYYKFDEHMLTSEYIVIVGNSFNETFSEVISANKLGCEMYSYTEFLGSLSMMFNSIAITGTHGKTTTTTMVTNLLQQQLEINYLIGDGNGGGNIAAELLVFEACEYKEHFLSYYPNYAIITNVGYDHLDYFTSQAMYDEAYLNFVSNVKDLVVVCGDDSKAKSLFTDCTKVVFYGTDKTFKYHAQNIEFTKTGTTFDFYIEDQLIMTYQTKVYGMHNVLNLLSSLAIASELQLDVVKLVSNYYGEVHPKRRFEEFLYEEQIIIDDYAHHPSELKVFLDAVFQKYQGKEVIIFFEPHTVERLGKFYKDFAEQLNRCDLQILLKVKVPLRDEVRIDEVHLESDIMLEYLNNGVMYDDNSFEIVSKKRDCIVLFVGATISNYTTLYMSYINLLFTKI